MPLAAMTLAPLDLGVVALFLAAILALGFSAKVRENSLLQFLAAGRSLTLPAFVATLVSTWYGGILGIGESVSYYGVGTWLLMGVPYYVFAIAYALWLAPRVREGAQISIPERFEARFGRGAALWGAGLVFLLSVPAAHVLMLGVLVQEFTQWPLAGSVVAATAIGTAFLYKGGLLADVRVGLLAFVMMYVGFATMLGFCLFTHPVSEVTKGISDPNLLTVTGGQQWPTILSFFILGAWTLADPGFHQRVSACESPSVGRRGVLVSTGFWLLFDLLSIGTAMYAIALLQPMPENPVAIFPRFAEQVLPPGLKAIFLCGMIGTITSAMVGYTLVAGGTLGREIVARLRRTSEDRVQNWVRGGFLVSSLVAVGLALQIEGVVALWYSWAGAMVGALLLPVLLAYGKRPWSPKVVSWALGLAFAVSLGWLAYTLRTNNPFQQVAWIQTSSGGKLMLPPVPPESEGQATLYSVGTLLPGLLVSGLVLVVGEGLRKRIGKNDGQR